LSEHSLPSPRETTLTLTIVGTAMVAFALSRTLGDAATAIACCCLTAFLPAAFFLPSSWKGRLSPDVATARATRLIPGGIFGVMIAPASPSFAAAIVLGVAGLYMYVASWTWWHRTRPARAWWAMTVGAASLFGLFSDLPRVLGWHTLGFAAFGAGAYIAGTAGLNSVPSPSSHET
jgi:hypothetical protein